VISYLIDVLLLRKFALFPSDDPSTDSRALMEWSQAGRAMLGRHPFDKREDNAFFFPICNEYVHYHRNLRRDVTCDMHLDRLPDSILAGRETRDK
jgi:hypothetical protein